MRIKHLNTPEAAKHILKLASEYNPELKRICAKIVGDCELSRAQLYRAGFCQGALTTLEMLHDGYLNVTLIEKRPD